MTKFNTEIQLIESEHLKVADEVTNLKARLQNQFSETEAARQEENRSVLAVERNRRQLQWQQEQLERQKIELDNTNKEIAFLEEQNIQQSLLVGQCQAVLREKNNSLISLSVDELLTQFSNSATQAAIVTQAQKDEKNRLSERQAILERSIQREMCFRIN